MSGIIRGIAGAFQGGQEPAAPVAGGQYERHMQERENFTPAVERGLKLNRVLQGAGISAIVLGLLAAADPSGFAEHARNLGDTIQGVNIRPLEDILGSVDTQFTGATATGGTETVTVAGQEGFVQELLDGLADGIADTAGNPVGIFAEDGGRVLVGAGGMVGGTAGLSYLNRRRQELYDEAEANLT